MLHTLISRLIYAYEILIIVYTILSWFVRSADSPVGEFYGALGKLVEPYLRFFRRILPPFGGVDVSPMVAILVLWLLRRFLI